ncbi:acyl carrier protein [Nitrospirillum viridazoti]|uniref:Acyl carrier protein n=1 Tax=Nitrospirillum amazonense TaxID=28077 RepID=A0A560IKI0_9PROT|nr:acyl carrier protein [Nitrospirillum amazonense]TWB58705.1 acyl carrier protein [Nitrospirillum amazonense]
MRPRRRLKPSYALLLNVWPEWTWRPRLERETTLFDFGAVCATTYRNCLRFGAWELHWSPVPVPPQPLFPASLNCRCQIIPLTESPMSNENRIRDLLVSCLLLDPDRVTRHAHLRDDLRMDELDRVNVQFELEEEFDVTVPDADIQSAFTVADLIALVEKLTLDGFNSAGSGPDPILRRAS